MFSEPCCVCTYVDSSTSVGLPVLGGQQDPVPSWCDSGQEAFLQNCPMSEFPGGDVGVPRHFSQCPQLP